MKTFVKELTVVLLLVVMVKSEDDHDTLIEILDELNKLKIQNMKQEEEIKFLLTENDDLKRDISSLRNPPHLHVCGGSYGNWINSNSRIINYLTLLYSSTNTEGGGLDISTGVFTSPWPGSYTVTWSLMAKNFQGENAFLIRLRKNGKEIVESLHASELTGQSGYTYDQGGRTLITHLDTGDTLDLYCDRCDRGSAGVGWTSFCVSLSTFDIV